MVNVATAETLAAETLADALGAAIADPEFVPLVERMLARYEGARNVVVPLRDAAGELGVSLPTVRDWIARGVLAELPHTPRAVTVPSLAMALAAQAASGAELDPRPLAKMLDQLRDTYLLQLAPEVAGTARNADFITYTEEDLDELERL